jgi:hypothetical protein
MHRRRRSSGLRRRRDRPRWFGFCGGFGRLRYRFRVGNLAKMLAGQLGMLDVERTRMRLFLRDANLREKIDQHLGLNLKFSRQFVDTDLIGI